MAYSINIEKETIKNKNYRKVLMTAKHLQLTVMSLKPKVEIGLEIHKTLDQFIRVESGTGKAIITNKNKEIEQVIKLKDGISLIIPQNTYHNIINTGKTELKLYSIYSKPNHPIDTIEKNKEEEEEE